MKRLAVMRYLFVLLTPFLLMACSKTWTHPDYTPERFERENAVCEDRALEMTRKGSRRREKELYVTCMRGQGWSQTIFEPVKADR